MGLLKRTDNIILVTVVSVITFFIAIFSILIDGIYDHDTDLFQFGPSDSLLFIGIKIDTIGKYIGLIIFMVIIELLDILQEEHLRPFITMIYDANLEQNQNELAPYSWYDLYFIHHFSLAADGLRQIIRIIVVTLQIPLAILVWILKEVTRIYFVRMVTNNWFKKNGRADEINVELNKNRRGRLKY